jgi:hypothetical protein
MRLKRIFVIILIILAIIAGLWLCMTVGEKSRPAACNYSDPSKTYIKNESNCIINFMCLKGKEAFSDECGCGCKDIEPVKNTCTPEQRAATACDAVLHQVCGWWNSSIQCFKYPCANTYTNECMACQDAKVYYWTQGACPTG